MTPNKLSRAGKALSCTAYRVFGAIASYTPSHPSYTRIQKDSGLARASVSAALRELNQYNIIHVQKKGNSGGFANEYCINSPDQWTLPSSANELVQDLNQFNGQTTPSSNGELVQDLNQFNTHTSPSSINELGVVHQLNSKKTNIKKPNKKNNKGSELHKNGNGFDFELIFSHFPKRDGDSGKAKGISLAREQIHTKEQYEQLLKAVKNYDAFVINNKSKDPSWCFTKLFSNFMDEGWTDWINRTPETKPEPIVLGGNECSKPDDIIF